jgi:methyl-accepting chemotaxis protein
MLSHSTVIVGLATLIADINLDGGVVSRADELRPAQILKNQGLERQRGAPSSWSLAVEADVLKNFRAARQLSEQLATARAAHQQLGMGDGNPRAMIDLYQAQIDIGEARTTEIDQQLASLGGASVGNAAADNWHNLLVQERNSIVREQRRLGTMINNLARQGRGLEQQKQDFNDEIDRLRNEYRKAAGDLRKSVDKIQKNYAELDKKAEVSKALADLATSTRTKQKLGPSKDLQTVIRWLQKAGGIGSERVSQPARRRNR